ncbi:peptidoglycan/xylan/chitin deacetylase (PgdA/CDA1 family) [Nonomuraea thailandensis]|uniref:Peptidoglycan/xylan/chitin deacetylase (PgdA/CDA1 family) n=1 Tax=Nonomuraea thailandensis TaxID=1188745 RepID=A0A9X2G8U1_9ACTN|nr:polysaccharide deacetylase family protein [Nonomuraea thailandensis]MCP2354411.1 peptidoglycan/xylan/chitin deacetylase (PgdA/CDA1 family) [Nonomuraea thailandensis]
MFRGQRMIGVACVLALAACAPAGTASSPSPGPSAPVTATPGRKTPEAAGPPGVKPRAGEVRPIPRAGGLPPVISSIPTRRKVVFLTIDDGWEQDPGFVRQVRDQRIPITAFAMRDAVEAKGTPDESGGPARYVGAGKWGYFRQLRDAGVPVENHTLTHPNLRLLGYPAQRRELCGSSKLIEKEIGTRPTLFRPPFGNYNTDTLRAAKSCGMSAVLLWTATVQPGGKIAYQVPDKKLRPGDVLLLHFRPNLARDFRILVNKIKRRGYELGDLQAYLAAARAR